MKVLDSTFLIDLLQGKKEVHKIIKKNKLLLTTQINMYEVIKGLFLKKLGSSKFFKTMELFNDIKVLSLDDNAIIKSVKIYADCRNRGLEIHNLDCLIAGITLSKGINKIVTRNVKHFKRIKGLKVESY